MVFLPDYRQIIKPLMSRGRYLHSLAVADEARNLARQYGADPDAAYLAGILHDICKDSPKADQLQRIEKSGIIFDDISRRSPSLWHAMAGSLYVRDELRIAHEEICLAVRYHTSARAAMTRLELVVYLADLTSRDRDYPDVELMRQYAAESLERAAFEALRFTMIDLAKQQREICLDTYQAYNYYCLK